MTLCACKAYQPLQILGLIAKVEVYQEDLSVGKGHVSMAIANADASGLNKALFKRNGFPPIADLIPTSLQHVLASFAGIITPAMMIATTCGFTQEQETAIIQVALILSGLDTLLQQFPLFGRIGSGLPILTGASLPSYRLFRQSASSSDSRRFWEPSS